MSATPETPARKIASFKIDPAEYELLEEVARREERSVSAVIRVALRRYLDERAQRDAA